MKTYNYKWIDFLANYNAIKVTNNNEFEKFKEFLIEFNLLEILYGMNTFEEWKTHARINNKREDIFLFEYNNNKGLSWSDDIKEHIEYYDVEPISISELDYVSRKFTLKKDMEIEY